MIYLKLQNCKYTRSENKASTRRKWNAAFDISSQVFFCLIGENGMLVLCIYLLIFRQVSTSAHTSPHTPGTLVYCTLPLYLHFRSFIDFLRWTRTHAIARLYAWQQLLGYISAGSLTYLVRISIIFCLVYRILSDISSSRVHCSHKLSTFLSSDCWCRSIYNVGKWDVSTEMRPALLGWQNQSWLQEHGMESS